MIEQVLTPAPLKKQELIAKVLADTDELVLLHAKQLGHYKLYKLALLQELINPEPKTKDNEN